MPRSPHSGRGSLSFFSNEVSCSYILVAAEAQATDHTRYRRRDGTNSVFFFLSSYFAIRGTSF